MSTLHPDLQRLEQQYDQLVTAAEEGHISAAEAVSTLAGLTVTDTSGAVWAINADGDYVRAAFPGAPAQIADPTQFATGAGAPQPHLDTPGTFPTDPTQHPTAAAAVDPGPPAGAPPAGFPTPPTGPFPAATSPHGPAAPSPTPPGAWDQTTWAPHGDVDPLAAPPAGFDPDGPAAHAAPSAANEIPDLFGDDPAPTKSKKQTRSLSDADTPSAAGAVLAKAGAYLSANKVLAGIVAVGIIVFVILANQGNDATTTIPSADDITVTESPAPVPDLPADEPAPAAPVPSKAMARETISKLGSARRDLVTGTVAGKVPAAEAAKGAALWAGVKKVGLKVTPGPAAPSGQGALQNWVVTDGVTRVANVKVTWVLAGNTWKLAAIPTF